VKGGSIVFWDFDGTLARRPGLWSGWVLEVLGEQVNQHGEAGRDTLSAMPDKTKIVLVGGGELTVEETPSTVQSRLSRKGARFAQLTKAGGIGVCVAVDQVAYIEQVRKRGAPARSRAEDARKRGSSMPTFSAGTKR